MRILLAQSAGFCFGVKRATQMAFEAADKFTRLCSLGPIIHSPQVVERLEEKGVRVVQDLDSADAEAVVVRSHGVTYPELEAIHARSLHLVDATCPFVKRAQKFAAMLSKQGYVVVVVGEEEHPEVQGIVSYARSGLVHVVANDAQAQALEPCRRMGLIAQTTQSLDNFRQVVQVCLEKSQELRVFNTICDATLVRQREAREIAQHSDVVLVIGGFNSANTTRLAQICREIQPRTHHIEVPGQLQPEWLREARILGITAGASTPGWLIEEVLARVRELSPEGQDADK